MDSSTFWPLLFHVCSFSVLWWLILVLHAATLKFFQYLRPHAVCKNIDFITIPRAVQDGGWIFTQQESQNLFIFVASLSSSLILMTSHHIFLSEMENPSASSLFLSREPPLMSPLIFTSPSRFPRGSFPIKILSNRKSDASYKHITRPPVLKSTQSLQSCPILCDPMDCSPPGSSVHGILQVRIVEWVAMPYSRGSSGPRDQIHVSCFAGRFFTSKPPGKKC